MPDRFRAGKRLWSPADDATLRRIYPHTRTSTIARQLRRSLVSIYQRADKLGLYKSAAYLLSSDACRLRRGDHVGAAFRFQPGHVPANKGLRRPGWGPGRMKATQFKAGHINGMAARRFQPIGSTRMLDGYLYRKVSAVPGPWTVNWTLEHRRIWEQAHGPIPPGHALVFKDRDPTHVRLDNLQLLTRRALLARNSVHTLPKPLADVVQLLGALNRQIRRRTSHASEQDRGSAESSVRDARSPERRREADGSRPGARGGGSGEGDRRIREGRSELSEGDGRPPMHDLSPERRRRPETRPRETERRAPSREAARMMKAFDVAACERLAQHFLGGIRADLEAAEYQALVADLRDVVQIAVEGWFESFDAESPDQAKAAR
jgi:HNH endonuclease